ncbi:MAG: hypothetical protein U0T11_02740 [Chitinophagaceae bacterium]
MKQIISLVLCLIAMYTCYAQADTSKNRIQNKTAVNQAKVQMIPAAKMNFVKQRTITLQSQMITFRDSLTNSKVEIDRLLKEIKEQTDKMNEMNEMESLRLQMAMDRLSKIMSTLSNMLKKISETSQSITQNLK